MVALAVLLVLMVTGQAQMIITPPAPNVQTIEMAASNSERIVTGTYRISHPVPGARWYDISYAVKSTLKGEPVPEITVRVRATRALLPPYIRLGDVYLISVPSTPGIDPFIADLSDPALVVLTAGLNLLRDAEEVMRRMLERIAETHGKPPAEKFAVPLPSKLIKAAGLEDPMQRGYREADVPVDEHLEAFARKELRSKDMRERINGLKALGLFKDADLHAVLPLLQDPEPLIDLQPAFNHGIEGREYPVRRAAVNLLQQRGFPIPSPAPVLEEFIDRIATVENLNWGGKIEEENLIALQANKVIRRLNLTANPLTAKEVLLVSRLASLKELILPSTELDDNKLAFLANLPNLEKLEIDRDPVSDKSVDTLVGMKSLKSLTIYLTDITDDGLAELRRRRPDLYIMQVNTRFPRKPKPPVMAKLTEADCPHIVYTLNPRRQPSKEWTMFNTGRLNGPLAHNRSPSGRDYFGPFGQQDVVLHLAKLAPHQDVHLEIELWVIGSWDGDGTLGPGPDIIGISVPEVGSLLHSTFFNNTEGDPAAPLQSFPDPYPGPGHIGYTGAFEVRSLGFIEPWDGHDYHRDAVYRLHYTFHHEGSELYVVFSGQNVPVSYLNKLTDDENWGIGGLRVSTD